MKIPREVYERTKLLVKSTSGTTADQHYRVYIYTHLLKGMHVFKGD